LKKLFKFIILSLGVLSLAYAALILILTLKEPCFIVPVDSVSGKIPVRNDAYGEGRFGAKRKGGRTHAGLDIASPLGSNVYASKSGFLIFKDLKKGYGKLVIVYHVDGYQTRYAHLAKFNNSSFRWVNQGDIIGYVGNTGNAGHKGIAPHLHFEIRKGGKCRDPIKYLKGRKA